MNTLTIIALVLLTTMLVTFSDVSSTSFIRVLLKCLDTLVDVVSIVCSASQ